MLHSDSIPGILASNIRRNKAYRISYIQKKKLNITDRRRTGDWKALMVTECTCHSDDWMVTERWLNGAFQFSRKGGVSSCVFSRRKYDCAKRFFSIEMKFFNTSNQRQNDKSYVSYTSDSTLTPMTIMITPVIQHQNTH